jgi:hypothetical protein
VDYSKRTFTYDTNGNQLTDLVEYWQNIVWVNCYKYTYTYNANGNMLTYLSESWQNNAWINWEKYTYTYDANGNSLTGKHEQWVNNNWVMSSNVYINFYYSSNKIVELVNTARYEAHFVSFANSITETNIKPINIYPNPATYNLTINLSQLKNLQNTSVSIYDIQGKLLLQQNIQQVQTEIDIATFAKGIYIIKVNNENESMVNKFVKE